MAVARAWSTAAAVRACLMLTVQAEGANVVTVEGLSSDARSALSGNYDWLGSRIKLLPLYNAIRPTRRSLPDLGRAAIPDARRGRARGTAHARDPRPAEPIDPEMRAGASVDQLLGDPHPVPGCANRPFEHIANAELAPDLLHIDGLPFVGEARIAGDDEEPADTGERRDDLLDHAVGKIFLLGIAAHIGERQYRNRRPCRGAATSTERAPWRRPAGIDQGLEPPALPAALL
jgi:hypothetical protein